MFSTTRAFTVSVADIPEHGGMDQPANGLTIDYLREPAPTTASAPHLTSLNSRPPHPPLLLLATVFGLADHVPHPLPTRRRAVLRVPRVRLELLAA
jgi:hypothetical protein